MSQQHVASIFAMGCALMCSETALAQVPSVTQSFLERLAHVRTELIVSPTSVELPTIDRASSSAAALSGDPGKFFMLSATDAEIDDARAAIGRDGGPRARKLFEALSESRAIYLSSNSRIGDSNGRRSLLMKQTLSGYFRTIPLQARVLFKFGDVHGYEGVNPLGQRHARQLRCRACRACRG